MPRSANFRHGNAREGIVLLSGRGSGLISPSRTSDCCCRRSTYARKRDRLMRPTGRRRALMRAGAIGDKGSTAIATSGRIKPEGLKGYNVSADIGGGDRCLHGVPNIGRGDRSMLKLRPRGGGQQWRLASFVRRPTRVSCNIAWDTCSHLGLIQTSTISSVFHFIF